MLLYLRIALRLSAILIQVPCTRGLERQQLVNQRPTITKTWQYNQQFQQQAWSQQVVKPARFKSGWRSMHPVKLWQFTQVAAAAASGDAVSDFNWTQEQIKDAGESVDSSKNLTENARLGQVRRFSYGDVKKVVRNVRKSFFKQFFAKGVPLKSAQDAIGLANESAVEAIPPERGLQVTTSLFILGCAISTLAPPPILIASLGVERGTALLTFIATAAAAVEILAAPLLGAASDSVGRKPVLLGTLFSIGCVNALVTIWPTVPVIAFSKFIGSFVIGMYFLSSGAFLGDWYRTQPKRLVAASGLLFALVNMGFGLGLAISARLPQGLSWIYGTSSAIVFLSLVICQFTVGESMPAANRVPFKLRDFRPFSFLRLLRNGRQLRLLTFLAMLTLQPLFMGDVVQIFAEVQWGLSRRAVSDLFVALSITGILGNLMAGPCIKRLGVQAFTAVAATSTMITWVGFTISHTVALACIALGVLGPARALGATSMITTTGARLGMPQGQLSGDRSNMMGVLKVIGPIIYGNLYLYGQSVGVPQMPFYLNIALCVAALLLAPAALADHSGNITSHKSA